MLNSVTGHGTDETPFLGKLKPARKKRALLAVAAIALLAGGTVLGTTLPDPRSSDAYLALAGEEAAAKSERDSAQTDYQSMKSKYDTLQNGNAAREAKLTAREFEVGKADAAVKTADTAVKIREDAVTGAEKTKAANTIADGTWTVGKDLEAGTYRATADVGSSCYWGIYATGSNGSTIIDNDLPGGGRPSVALSGGQDFKSSRCGKWEKQ
ncbi:MULTISPECIES: hypothetical protein [unclassified Arthrobacter]|uniref:hypothetical protein n=1 Tax=unclassified Arthrobacter TaxID=235627 RepID=UPI001CFFDEE2|nr:MULTISPECIES: hypothetical protein [unclassified Arthrobacter]MCB5281886.1 hypothetical protein [Arthrobacter sp. ES1]WGZ78121.1 hypothetical protein QI450_09310 [Arthrobacter sp. EM1]